ncbi:MAG: glycosyltransferase family 4 protein, partial [Candidatus Omnitrophota bacterium]
LNLTPPYNVSVNGGGEGDFYYFTTDWLKKSVWRPVKGAYHALPKPLRDRLRLPKQFIFKNLIGTLPPAEKWITLCHDLTPVIKREWFSFPADWRVDVLGNFLKSRHVISVSENTKRDLAKHGVEAGKVSVVYNTYDDAFNLARPAAKPLLDDYLLVVGSFEPRKNAANVYAAFSGIREKISSKLVFVGGDEWGDRGIYDRIQKDPRCLLLKKLPKRELIGWYHGARALVYASWYEGFGLPVLEAAGCGIPVVSSGTSGMLEAGEGYAEFADPSSPEDIARQILKVMEPGYRVRLDARDRLLHKFSASENAKRLKAVLDGVCAAPADCPSEVLSSEAGCLS